MLKFIVPKRPIIGSISLSLLLLTLTSFSYAVSAATAVVFQSAPQSVLAGEAYLYTIQYRCASNTENCEDVLITNTLPPDVEFVDALGTGASYDSATHTVRFSVGQVPAGVSSVVEILARVKNGAVPDGTLIENTITLELSNGPPATSNIVSTAVEANNNWDMVKSGDSVALLDTEYTYTIEYAYPGSTNEPGQLNLTDLTLVDNLPTGVVYVQSDSDSHGTGVYDSGSHTVTWSNITLDAAQSNEYRFYVTVTFPDSFFDLGNSSINTVQTTFSPVGEPPVTLSGEHPVTIVDFVPNPDIEVDKNGPDEYILGSNAVVEYRMEFENKGNVALDNYTITDIFPPQFTFTEYERIVYSNTLTYTLSYVVSYNTNLNSSWQSWPGTPFQGDINATHPITELGLGVGERVTGLRWVYDALPPAFEVDRHEIIRGTVTEPLDHNGDPVTIGTTITNCLDATADYAGQAHTNQGCNLMPVRGPSAVPQPQIALVDDNRAYTPGDPVGFQLTLQSGGELGAINPVIMVLLPPGFNYIPDSWRFDPAEHPPGTPNPTFEEIPDYDDEGNTLLRWTWDDFNSFTTIPESISYIIFDSLITNEAPIETIHSVYMDADNMDSLCPDFILDENDLDGDGNQSENLCRDTLAFRTARLALLDSSKWVLGAPEFEPFNPINADVCEINANGYTRFPCVARTTQGGIADYQLFVTNSGNISMTEIVLVDIFPHIGDTEIVNPAIARLTEWVPTLAGPVAAPSGVTVYYSTQTNPCRDEVKLPADPSPFPTGCTPPNWSTTPPAPIADVASVKFDFDGLVLQPGDSFQLDWPMRVPLDAPTDGEIAWNAFAYIATRMDTNEQILPAEPFKVGIATQPAILGTYGNYVWLDSNQNGLQDDGSTGIQGVRVELYRDLGDGIGDPLSDEFVSFTLTDAQGEYIFPNLIPGDYFAVFYPPPTYIISPVDVNQNSNDGIDSDGTPTVINSTEVAIAPLTTIEGDEEDLTWDQGLYLQPQALTAVGNYVWFDENGDGIQNEPVANGINGVTVNLYQSDATFVDSTLTQDDVTGNPGFYLFDLLPAGGYFLEFVLPDAALGFTIQGASGSSDPVDSDVDINSGRTETFALTDGLYDDSWDAGILLPTGNLTLGDTVWLDADADGLYEPGDGEVGINNVVVNLYIDSDGNNVYTPDIDTFFASTTTFTRNDMPGYYEFTHLPPDDYIVQVDPLNFGSGNVLESHQSSGSTAAPDPDDDTNNDDNGDPMLGYGVVSQAITLAAGTEPIDDGDTDTNSNLTVDLGFVLIPPKVAIGNLVWRDEGTGNGIFDGAESGIDTVTVELYRDGIDSIGVPFSSTTTSGGGFYLFDQLDEGAYFVHIPANEFISSDLQGLLSSPGSGNDDDQDDDRDENGLDVGMAGGVSSAVIDLSADSEPSNESGQGVYTGTLDDNHVNLTVDFAFWAPAPRIDLEKATHGPDQTPQDADIAPGPQISLGDTVTWTYEVINNGIVTLTNITLVDDMEGQVPCPFSELGPNAQMTCLLTGVVTSMGQYANSAVVTGTPTLGVMTPVTDSDPSHYNAVALNLGNLVWHDANRNGLLDADEAGIDGVDVQLFAAGSDPSTAIPLATTTTATTHGIKGIYNFSALMPGAYVVCIPTPPSAYPASTTPTDSADNGEDNDDNGLQGDNDQAGPGERVCSPTIQLDVDEEPDTHIDGDGTQGDLTVDFGFVEVHVNLGNQVWHDANNNGLLDIDEEGIDGVDVQLFSATDDPSITSPLATTTTATIEDAKGIYNFAALTPGAYVVCIPTPPSVYPASSTPTDHTDNGEDSDDNGLQGDNDQGSPGQRVCSPAIQLGVAEEPDMAIDGDDTNGDLTVDFGFWEPAPLIDLEKATHGPNQTAQDADTAPGPQIALGEAVTWTYQVTNRGIVPLRDILLVDDQEGEITCPKDLLSPSESMHCLWNSTVENLGQYANTAIVTGTPTIGISTPVTDSDPSHYFAVGVNLGNRVWHDVNNNGLIDNSEVGINNVTLQLFHSGDDPTTDIPLATTTSQRVNGVDGIYNFDGLRPGTYFVYIPIPPAAYPISSLSTGLADNGQDNDDNGLQVGVTLQDFLNKPVRSPDIELQVGQEPSNDVDGDGSNGDLTVDFGFFVPTASLGDLVWYDANRDGTQDSIETGNPGSPVHLGVSGILITLYNGQGEPLGTTATDSNGNYRFDRLPPGDYFVEFTLPTGYSLSPADSAGNPPGSDDIFDSDPNLNTLRTPITNLSAEEHDPTLDMGIYIDTPSTAALGDYVWLDRNRDGIQDVDETGVPGVKVQLYNDENRLIDTTQTNANGSYLFSNLQPDEYYIVFTPSTGYQFSPQDATTNGVASDTADSDADLNSGRTRLITLTAGEYDSTWDAGLYTESEPAAIGDFVWLDRDQDGRQSENETGIPNVVVTLYNSDDTVVVQTTTDVDGKYLFTNLIPGDYYLHFETPTGYDVTTADQGDASNDADSIDSDIDPATGRTIHITLEAGESDDSWDAGFILKLVASDGALSTVGDRVWFDTDADGFQDTGEQNMVGIVVKLYTTQGERVAIAITDAEGRYRFTNLTPGDYYVEFVPPAGYSVSPVDTDSGDNTDSNAHLSTGRTVLIPLTPGQTDLTWDMGVYLVPTALDVVDEPAPYRGQSHIFLPIVRR